MLVKTHLIITDQYDDYEVKYVAKLIDLTPSLTSRNSMSFVIVSRNSRYEVNTNDFKFLEQVQENPQKTIDLSYVWFSHNYLNSQNRGT